MEEAAKKFFESRFKAESQVLGPSVDIDKELKAKWQNQKAFLVRIGRHSGAESLTIEENRKIKNRQKGMTMTESTTLWLAANQKEEKNRKNALPFGWCMLEVIDSGENYG